MIRSRRRSPMQGAFDGLSVRDAQRLRAYLDHGQSKSPRAGDSAAVTQRGNRRGKRV